MPQRERVKVEISTGTINVCSDSVEASMEEEGDQGKIIENSSSDQNPCMDNGINDDVVDGGSGVTVESSGDKLRVAGRLGDVASEPKTVSKVQAKKVKSRASEKGILASTMETPDDVLQPGGNFRRLSAHAKLFGLDFYSLSHLLEKTSVDVLKAAKTGDIKMLRELHAMGYSLLSIDSSGQTALHVGSQHGHKDIIKYLIASAPTSILNMVDNDKGRTALHKAAAHKQRSICCMLVAGGASLMLVDHDGQTPRQLALQSNDHELAAYLESQEQFQLVAEDMETVV